jgi:hypothetical protein
MTNILRRILNSFGAALAGVVFVLVATTTHVSAVSMPTHDMSGMSHASSKSPSCASLCTSTPVEKQQKIKDIADEQDDEPQPLTNYTYNTQAITTHGGMPDNSLSWRLLKVPLHVLYEVYRN